MRDLTEILFNINQAYETYETLQLGLEEDQKDLLRKFSTYEHYLGLCLDDLEDDWQTAYDSYSGEKKEVAARKEAHANSKVPMYKKMKRLYERLKSVQIAIGKTL